jgi:hypothetical protein
VTFTGLPADVPWIVVAGKNGKRSGTGLSAPHRDDAAISLSMLAGTSPVCPGTPARVVTAQPGTDPTFSAAVPLARLGEEKLERHGPHTYVAEALLDCKSFGPKYVMVAIAGKVGQVIDNIRVGCSEVVGGGLTNVVKWTITFGGANMATDFERHCDDDQAVGGIQGTSIRFEGEDVHDNNNRVTSLVLRCRQIGPAGLTAGGFTSKARVGRTETPWPADNCTQNRPARALHVEKHFYWEISGSYPFISYTTGPQVIVTAQLICEQPQL